MRKQYDVSKAEPDPYAKRLKRSVTIRLDTATIDYFKRLAPETQICGIVRYMSGSCYAGAPPTRLAPLGRGGTKVRVDAGLIARS